ncbi:MAG: hypothetical protein AB7E12_07375 [Burkholderiaceae bacterium]
MNSNKHIHAEIKIGALPQTLEALLALQGIAVSPRELQGLAKTLERLAPKPAAHKSHAA